MTPSDRRGLIVACALSGVLTLAAGFGVLFRHQTFIPTDLMTARPPWAAPGHNDAPVRGRLHLDISEFFAMNVVQAQADLRSGEGILWNKAVLGGIPIAGDPQVGTFYPPRWVLLKSLPPAAAIDVFILVHFFFVLPAMYLFLRGRGLDTGPALFGALAWALGGQVMVWFKYGCGLVAAVFLPLQALALDRAWERRSLAWAAGAGALWAALFLGSHPQLSFFALAWAVLRGAAGLRERGLRFGLAAGTAFSAAGLALAAAQLLPFLDLLSHSQKNITVLVSNFSKPSRTPGMLLTLLWPRAYGSPVDRLDLTGSWLGGNFFEFSAYLGLLPLLLMPLAGRGCRIFWIAAGANLLLAVAAPVWWVLRLVPPFHAMVPHRLFLFGFSAAALAAFGLQAVLRDGTPRLLLHLVLAGAGTTLLAGLAGLARGATWISLGNEPYRAFALAALLAAATLVHLSRRRGPRLDAALALLVLTLDLLPFFLRFNDTHPPLPAPAPAVDALPRDTRILVDTPSSYWRTDFRNYVSLSGHETVTGHASMFPAIYAELVRALTAPDPVHPPLLKPSHTRALRALNVGHVLTHEGPRTLPCLPRAWLVGRTEFWPAKAGRLARLADPTLDLGTTALVEQPLPDWTDRNPAGRVERRSPREYQVGSPTGGLLVVSETWDAGWRAEVDGRPAVLHRVNHAMRGVVLEPGEHRIRFEYRPWTVNAGLWISGLSALLLLAAAVRAGRPRRGLSPAPASPSRYT